MRNGVRKNARPFGGLWHGGGFVVMRPPNETITLARRLRRNLSPPEARLWNRLRERMPGRPVFRRQHPIEPYVLDFYLRRGAACG